MFKVHLIDLEVRFQDRQLENSDAEADEDHAMLRYDQNNSQTDPEVRTVE